MLGYANPRDAIAKHCKGSSKTRHPSAGGEQEVTIIPERDVYRLIMRADSNISNADLANAGVR